MVNGRVGDMQGEREKRLSRGDARQHRCKVLGRKREGDEEGHTIRGLNNAISILLAALQPWSVCRSYTNVQQFRLFGVDWMEA